MKINQDGDIETGLKGFMLIVFSIGLIAFLSLVLMFGSSPHSDFLYTYFGCDLNDLSYCFDGSKARRG